jgi:hypothetical protein
LIKKSRHGNAPESKEREEFGTLHDVVKTYQMSLPFATLEPPSVTPRRTQDPLSLAAVPPGSSPSLTLAAGSPRILMHLTRNVSS